MLVIAPEKLISLGISQLSAGQPFLHRGCTCLALARSEGYNPWVRLSGTDPFELYEGKARDGDSAIVSLSVSAEQLRFRLNPSAIAKDPAELTPGRLVIEKRGGAYIQAYWPNTAGAEYRNGFSTGWEYEANIEPPLVAYTEWRLSVFNHEDRTWYDLVHYNERE